MQSLSTELWRLPRVLAATGKSRSRLYADIRAGKFPSPTKIGPRASAWPSNEVQKWIEAHHIPSTTKQS